MTTYKDWIESDSNSIYFVDEPHDRIDEIRVDVKGSPFPYRMTKGLAWNKLVNNPDKQDWNKRGERGIDTGKCYLSYEEALAELTKIREAKKTLKKEK